ncbi:MAG: glycine/sarcosine/betaine reductase component B subunit [Synergistaceae bacterium]|nr:glycine/sarcosine/betaine reductase component B subunit [Synergistaceae bacterium]MBP9626129.1 glycine/sarcosine/betaine reductase component B subunit [Synergistaceae bacterium]MBP9957666.1 glycine/sarcosine/betaine reductase component B subunit [Synergistaceae bacterium]
MKLELGKVHVKDVRFGSVTKIQNGVLHVNAEELQKLVLKDDRLIGCRIELAHPGESVRITPVKDVIEPRLKIKGAGNIFPGVMGKVTQVGEGVTYCMDGVCVVTVGQIVGFQEGVIDMSGPAAEYCPFSQTQNVCVVIEPQEGLETHVYESAGRMAGLTAAAYLADALRDQTPDETIVYETKPLLEQAAQYPDLPRVGYIHMLQSQGLLHDTYYYGVDAKQIVPTLMYPTEIFDGAIVSGNCVAPCDKVTTYHHLHNPVIEDLYAQHGKTLNFMGVILTNENVFLMDKERHSDMTAKLCEYIGLEGALLTEEGYGNPDTDLMMNCKKTTQKGIKVVIITDEFPGRDGKSYSLADICEEADTMISCGNGNVVIHFPPMDRLIGTQEYIEMQIGGWVGCVDEDGGFDAEIQIIIASTIANGFNKLCARGY